MRPRSALPAVALVLLATACTTSHVDNPTLTTPPSISPTATASAPATTGPCELVTPTQVQAAFGGMATTGHTLPDGAHCDWALATSNLGGAAVSVTLALLPAPSPASFEAGRAGAGGTTEPELGTDAYWVPAESSLSVLLGSHEVIVQAAVGGSGHPAATALEADLMALARTAEAALPN